ncbi:MAG: gfo/Idh/MocA family oxidoreductase, partial [Planctomycetota bacterium]
AYSDESSATLPLVILHNDGRIERPSVADTDPIDSFVAEVDAMAKSILSGSVDPRLDAKTAADAIKICHWQAESRVSRAAK